MKKFRLKYLVPIITLLSSLYIFYLALESDSSITDQQSTVLVICGFFLLLIFIANLIKIVKSKITK
jgi:uncharacterized membrane protein YbhN (UPF0104 family)